MSGACAVSDADSISEEAVPAAVVSAAVLSAAADSVCVSASDSAETDPACAEEDSVCAADEQAVRDRDSRSAPASAVQVGLLKQFFFLLHNES